MKKSQIRKPTWAEADDTAREIWEGGGVFAIPRQYECFHIRILDRVSA